MVHPYAAPIPGSPRPVPATSSSSLVLLVLGFVLIAGCGLAVSLVVLLSTGPVAFVLGLLFALIPVAPLLAFYWWVDRYEPEPRGLLIFAFGWGAAIATLGSLIINLASIYALDVAGQDSDYLGAVLVAPVVEEALKGLGLLAIIVVGRRRLDGVVDGVVYAGVVGVGFAFVENILYLGSALMESGGAGLLLTFAARGIASPFAHPLFTSAFGIGVALASRFRGAGRLIAVVGYAAAVGLHALWNATASLSFDGFVTGFIVLQIPIFAVYIAFILWFRSREGRLIRRYLGAYASVGWLTPREVQVVGSLSLRSRHRDAAGRGGPGAPTRTAAVRAFHRTAIQLAYLRHRIETGSAPLRAAVMERQLLESLAGQRAVGSPLP